ncbi:hypothetical protein ACQVP2_31905 [Methylobacterium aquaticum]|uniref:hypothetical protein n=1 Tax=Methylobacterium aquaticum TaxID=270351 RepID=UPI003D16665B
MQVILPRWVDHIASVGLVLFVLAQGIAATTRQGWPRVVPLLIAVLVLPVAVVIIAFVGLTMQRAEINRITLPDGRVVMMTLEPVLTDTVLDLWEPHGWRWRSFLNGGNATYSEDGSFTDAPLLVLAKDGRHLMVRRGGIWTDCWTTEAKPRSCASGENGQPVTRAEWLSRSAQIAATIGLDPS